MTQRQVHRHDDGRVLAFRCGDVELARYTYLDEGAAVESPRPHFHPLRTLTGRVVSGWRPWDHRWHRGLSLALPHVGATNLWGGPTHVAGRGYVQLDNNGTMRHVAFLQHGAANLTGDGVTAVQTAEALEDLDWLEPSGHRLARERRTIGVSVLPDADAWELHVQTTWLNTSGADLLFGSPTTNGRPGAGYGGLFWRGPRDFVDGTVLGPTGKGTVGMGERAPWLAYVGQHDEVDQASTLLFVDDPGNERFPAPWFIRTQPFPAVCSAPFFAEELRLAEGATITWRYRVVVGTGAWDAERAAQIAASPARVGG